MKIFSPQFMREGPGVNKDDPAKEGLYLFFQLLTARFWDIVKLNIIFIFYCIPIITIGPALGALTSITMSMVQSKHVYIFSDFHKSFRANWKQSLICNFIFTFLFTLLIVALLFYFRKAQENVIFYPLVFLCIFIATLLMLAMLYTFPLLTTISLSINDIFKNSLFLGIVCLKNTLIGILVCGIIIGINLMFFPLTLPLILIFSFSILSFISSFIAWPKIKKYIIKD